MRNNTKILDLDHTASVMTSITAKAVAPTTWMAQALKRR
jgi:hypothetical protein